MNYIESINKNYNAGIYIRLSREDDDKTFESESITNQKSLLLQYAKDISKKIKSSLRAKQKEGKWVGGRTPFGYNIDPDNKNHLIINEKQSLVVKRIYNLSLKGLSFYKIAK